MNFTAFISHSVDPVELGIVYAIADEAARRGMQPHIPDRNWDPAGQLPERILAALSEADVCVAVATQSGKQLAWMNAEIAGASFKPIPLMAILDSSLPPQEPRIEAARVTITRDDLPGTIARAAQAIENVRIGQNQKAALTWLVIGGLLFMLTQGDR